MKITLITNQTIGILAYIPIGKKGITIYPITWGFWKPSQGFYKLFSIRSKDLALIDYIDHHPTSPWHLLKELEA